MPYVMMPKIDSLRKMVKTMEHVSKSKRSAAIASEVKHELIELIQYAEDLTKEVNYPKEPAEKASTSEANTGTYEVEVEDGYYPVE